MGADMTEQAPATSLTPPAEAAAPSREAKLTPQGGRGAVKGDMRAGVGFWSMGTLVVGVASDLAKPVADLAPYLFAAFLVVAAACAWLAFFRKPPIGIARTLLGAAAIGAGVFGFFLIAPLLAGSEGKDRGIIAAVAPPLAAVQSAVLPLSPVEKELLALGSSLSHGDPEARSAAARTALGNPDEDAALRRAKLERVLRNSDPNIQQAGIVRALADRGRAPVSVMPDEAAPESELKTLLFGAQFALRSVDVDTGAVAGVFTAGGSNRPLSGSVANGRVILNSQYVVEGRWRNGLVLDLRIDEAFGLVGRAQTPTDAPVPVEAPLL
jgi:hypothetical protein